MNKVVAVVSVLLLAQCFPVSPTTPSKAKCEYCWSSECFNKASCNGSCICVKGPGEQTGACASISYRQVYLEHGYTESK